MKKLKRTILLVVAVILCILVVWTIWSNTALEVNTYVFINEDLPAAFDGFRIAHISDLHNATFGTDNQDLILLLKESQPDIIVITGDLIDSRRTDIDIAKAFIAEATTIAPCYYVTGNHEARVSEYDDLKNYLLQLGVIILDDANCTIQRSDEKISLIGINDPSFETDYLTGDAASIVSSKLNELTTSTAEFSILLSHRPELFEIYVDSNIDLVFSGHAHGGQIRLPLIGGIIAPNQGLFPEYDNGLYSSDETTMVVSRGIGNSLFPFRFNNRPEIVVIELKSK